MARAFVADINVHLAGKAHVDLDGGVGCRAAEGMDRAVQPAAEPGVFFGEGRDKGFAGEVHGTWVAPPRGANGFGYDPMFLPDGAALTFGEMAPAEKHAHNHRARAFALLAAACLPPA
jgi:XTP/dITP diphosphohydrolase